MPSEQLKRIVDFDLFLLLFLLMEKTETGKKWTRRGVTLAFSVYFIYRKCPSFVLFLVSSSPVIAVALFFLWIIMYSDRKSNGKQLYSSDDGEDLLSNSSVSSSSSKEEEEHEDSTEKPRRLEWTTDDEKNMRLVGSSELEKNLRLEHLIEKRRSRNYQRSQTFVNLIDSNLLMPTTTDHHHHHHRRRHNHRQRPTDNSDEEGEEEETENSKTEVVKKHWMNARCRLSYGMKQMLESEEHAVESLSSDNSTDDEEEEEDGDYVDEDQITEPVFQSSKSLKEALHYMNKESTSPRSYNSLASDMQVEISECGSPTKHHHRQHHHGSSIEDGNSSWVASSKLAMVDQVESRTRELNEISESDVFQKLSSTEEGEEEEEDDDMTPPAMSGGSEKSNRNHEHASFLNRSIMVNRSVMRDLDISDLDFKEQSMTPSSGFEDGFHRRSKSTNL